MLGTNDSNPGKGVAIDQYKANLKTIIEKAKAKNATVILRSPTASKWGNVKDTISNYVAKMKEVADEDPSLIYVDQYSEWDTMFKTYPYLWEPPYTIITDRFPVHPGPNGQAMLTKSLIKELGYPTVDSQIANVAYKMPITDVNVDVDAGVQITKDEFSLSIEDFKSKISYSVEDIELVVKQLGSDKLITVKGTDGILKSGRVELRNDYEVWVKARKKATPETIITTKVTYPLRSEKKEGLKQDPLPEAKIEEKTRTEVEKLPFNIVEKQDESMLKGTSKVEEKGKEGSITREYKDYIVDGKVIKSELLLETKEEPKEEPKDEVVIVGTKSLELKDDATGVRVIFDTPVDSAVKALSIVKKERQIVGFENNVTEIFDLQLLDDTNTEFRHDGNRTVIVPITNPNIEKVLYLKSETEHEEVPFKVNGSTLEFSVNHFSEYAIVYANKVEKLDNKDSKETPKVEPKIEKTESKKSDVDTSDYTGYYAILALISVCGVLFLQKNRK